MLDGEVFTFSGVNIYWLGQDENNPNSPKGESPYYSHPSMFRIDDVLFSALSMGSRVVRSHTLGKNLPSPSLGRMKLTCAGVSTGNGDYHYQHMGWNGTLWPDSHDNVQDNFASIDYAVYRAGQLGLKLIIPLTDNWNYYHGGIHDFLGWRNQSQLAGVEDNCVCNIDPHLQDIFFTDPDIVQDFKDYISFILNHVNPLTDIGKRLTMNIMTTDSFIHCSSEG